MPDIQLTPPNWTIAAAWRWNTILAYMQWPTDEAARRAYMVSLAVSEFRYLDEIGKAGPPIELQDDVWAIAANQVSVRVIKERVRTGEFETAGGWAAIQGFPRTAGYDADRAWREMKSVGYALYLIRKMATHHSSEIRGGASLNKARTLVVRKDAPADLLKNETDFNLAWKKFRSVAHLCCAFLYDCFNNPTERRHGNMAYALALFLPIARDYQNFATTFYPKTRKAPLIRLEDMWSIPSSMLLPAAPKHLTTPLSQELLSLVTGDLKNRRHRNPKK